jgi:hypothetical protein
MQKISTYLYPNRVQLLADLAGFTTEYTNVYQRTVKIYNGIDNVIEFDVKNADQKRINLTNYTLSLNVMDAAGNGLANSPYEISVLNQTTNKGLASVTIPFDDIKNLKNQYFKYSVTAEPTGLAPAVILYTDSKFSAVGTIQLVETIVPPLEDALREYKDFTAEIDLKGQPTFHSSAIPVTFYEAEKTPQINIDVYLTGFVGSIWVEATTQSTVNTEAFKRSSYLRSISFGTDAPANTPVSFDNLPVGNYKYFRISYQTPLSNGIGASFTVTTTNNTYDVVIKAGGTAYGVGSQLKVLGSLLGGTDGINDLIISVTAIEGGAGSSSYALSSITGITVSGVAVNGNSTYTVTGTNITGQVDKLVVS